MAFCKFCNAQVSDGLICADCLNANRQEEAAAKAMPRFSLSSLKNSASSAPPSLQPAAPKSVQTSASSGSSLGSGANSSLGSGGSALGSSASVALGSSGSASGLGGSALGSSGAALGSSGSASGLGGSALGLGGAASGLGASASGLGGAALGSSGSASGSSANSSLGSGGSASGSGGAALGSSANSSLGSSGSASGSGGSASGSSGSASGLGGAASGLGGSVSGSSGGLFKPKATAETVPSGMPPKPAKPFSLSELSKKYAHPQQAPAPIGGADSPLSAPQTRQNNMPPPPEPAKPTLANADFGAEASGKSKKLTAGSAMQDEAELSKIQKNVFSSEVTGYGDEDLEVAILAAVMKDTYILDALKGKGLMTGLFSTRFSRAIFQSILSLREESPDMTSLDKIVIKNKLKNLNLLNDSTQAIIDKIIAERPIALDRAIYFLELMKTQALKRKLKEVSTNISEFIDNPEKHTGDTIETFTNRVIQDVRNIQKAKTTKRINLVKEEMREIVGDIEQREIDGEIDIIGYSCEPMHYLNMAISGFRKGFMYAIAGAPRRGKTTFTLELATRVATLNKIPVLFFTYEQTKKNLTYRLLAKESRLNPDTLQRKKIRSDIVFDAKFMGGWKKMQEYMNYFYIVEATKEDTVDRIRSYAYNAMQDFNTQDVMVFVDYIQKMPLSRNYNDEKFKIEEISTELKALSIELNNPIMTISSLSKEGCQIDATDDASRPTMYHCKGSGDLEYDLDCAMIQAKDWGDTHELFQQLQHRAEELGKDATRIPKVDVVNLYLDKNRDAPEGIYSTLQYLFFIEDNKFVELGPKFDDDRYRYSKIEELVNKLIKENFIVFYDKPKESNYNKGRVSIKLKNF